MAHGNWEIKEAKKCGNLILLTRQLMFNQQKKKKHNNQQHSHTPAPNWIFLRYLFFSHCIRCFSTHFIRTILCSKALALSLLNLLVFFFSFFLSLFLFRCSCRNGKKIARYWIFCYGLEFVWFPADSINRVCSIQFGWVFFRMAFTHFCLNDLHQNIVIVFFLILFNWWLWNFINSFVFLNISHKFKCNKKYFSFFWDQEIFVPWKINVKVYWNICLHSVWHQKQTILIGSCDKKKLWLFLIESTNQSFHLLLVRSRTVHS